MTPQEEWRPVVGYEGMYEVSNLGRVRSLPRPIRTSGPNMRMTKGTVLKPYLGDRYAKVTFVIDKRGRTRYVHALVAEAFIGPRPEGQEVCHNNGEAQDNRAENLRYDTHAGNVRDTVEHGTHWRVARTHCDNGHEYTPENTYPTPKYRRCRTCVRNYRLTQKESA